MKEDTAYHVKALAVPQVPSARHGALECSPKDCNNCPGINNGLGDPGEPFIFRRWREAPDEHGQG